MSEERQTTPPPEKSPELARDMAWGRRNWLVLTAGVILLGSGYVAMWLARQDAGAWAGRMSPFLIMAGYAVVFASVLVEDRRGNHSQKNDRNT